MKLLLDTHTFLWWCSADPKLSQPATTAIADASNDVFVSAVNGWEISIKSRLGKLPLPDKPDVFISKMLKQHAFAVLPVTMSHAVAEFDLRTHHNDPFDRLLIAQAVVEGLTIVTNDAQIKTYSVSSLW